MAKHSDKEEYLYRIIGWWKSESQQNIKDPVWCLKKEEENVWWERGDYVVEIRLREMLEKNMDFLHKKINAEKYNVV